MEPAAPGISRRPLPPRLEGLWDLAYNLWWSWHPEARMLFKTLHRAGWKGSVHNPVALLADCSPDVFEEAARNPAFLERYDSVLAAFRADMQPPPAAVEGVAQGEFAVGFFSAEFGLHHSLPFFAGGLGFLAGDLLKECSDLGFPVVGVGFMYPEGYLQQRLSPDGWQLSEDEPVNREHAPIARVLTAAGQPLTVEVPFLRPAVRVGVWKVQVGRVPLYLLDTALEENEPWNREISARLYAGNRELRLRQEIVLGMGGPEVLRALGVKHRLQHLNEGHSAFAILDSIRRRVSAGLPFPEAYEQVRQTTIFTTHTPIPAGHDVFPFTMMEKYFCDCWPELGLSRDAFFQLGLNPDAPGEGFNMTAFALRSSARHNGVSRRHGEVARRMWRSLWPGLAEADVPIDAITNGVHVPTWIEPKMELLLNRHLGPTWRAEHDKPETWAGIAGIPDEELWRLHQWLKVKLVNWIREQSRGLFVDGRGEGLIRASGIFLSPNVLTLGFARRFATYKRAALLLQQPERLKALLTNEWRPIQVVFAGKAHPDDTPGKNLLRQIVAAAQDPAYGGRLAFVEDYDEQVAQYLVHGVDVWLNNPQPPLEASGTSGMKALLNGVPQLSILDGWWIEGFNGMNGWAFGGEGAPQGDDADAAALYALLENEVVPRYYDVDADGIPRRWVALMKEAIASFSPRFSARRMVREYAERYYLPALKARLQPRATDAIAFPADGV
jgi:starch phosphorylase